MFLTDAGGRPGLGKEVEIPAPPVPGLPRLTVPFDRDLLALVPQVGVFSPWATQVGDFEWTELDHATADVILLDLGAAMAVTAPLGLGAPGFVAIVTEAPVTAEEAERAYEGSQYALHSVQAAYRQNDSAALPRIYFLLWGALADPSEAGSKSLSAVAAAVGGRGGYAVPVPGQSRQPQPSLRAAWEAQFGGAPMISGQGPIQVQRPTSEPPLEEKPGGGSGWLLPVAVGLGVAVVTTGIVVALRRS